MMGHTMAEYNKHLNRSVVEYGEKYPWEKKTESKEFIYFSWQFIDLLDQMFSVLLYSNIFLVCRIKKHILVSPDNFSISNSIDCLSLEPGSRRIQIPQQTLWEHVNSTQLAQKMLHPGLEPRANHWVTVPPSSFVLKLLKFKFIWNKTQVQGFEDPKNCLHIFSKMKKNVLQAL